MKIFKTSLMTVLVLLHSALSIEADTGYTNKLSTDAPKKVKALNIFDIDDVVSNIAADKNLKVAATMLSKDSLTYNMHGHHDRKLTLKINKAGAGFELNLDDEANLTPVKLSVPNKSYYTSEIKNFLKNSINSKAKPIARALHDLKTITQETLTVFKESGKCPSLDSVNEFAGKIVCGSKPSGSDKEDVSSPVFYLFIKEGNKPNQLIFTATDMANYDYKYETHMQHNTHNVAILNVENLGAGVKENAPPGKDVPPNAGIDALKKEIIEKVLGFFLTTTNEWKKPPAKIDLKNVLSSLGIKMTCELEKESTIGLHTCAIEDPTLKKSLYMVKDKDVTSFITTGLTNPASISISGKAPDKEEQSAISELSNKSTVPPSPTFKTKISDLIIELLKTKTGCEKAALEAKDYQDTYGFASAKGCNFEFLYVLWQFGLMDHFVFKIEVSSVATEFTVKNTAPEPTAKNDKTTKKPKDTLDILKGDIERFIAMANSIEKKAKDNTQQAEITLKTLVEGLNKYYNSRTDEHKNVTCTEAKSPENATTAICRHNTSKLIYARIDIDPKNFDKTVKVKNPEAQGDKKQYTAVTIGASNRGDPITELTPILNEKYSKQ